MNSFNGYDDAKKAAQASALAKLPAGAYVCKVKEVRYESADYGDKIVLAFDIHEGDQKDFFAKQFEANTSEDKKWKGKANIWVPKDDGSDKDNYTKKSFAGWTDSFEKSNKGYSWDWDEKKWKNKLVGIVFGETGTVIEGKEIVYTEARFAVPIEDVRSGKAPAAKFKAKNGYTGNGSANNSAGSDDKFMNIPAGSNDEIPF